MIQNYGSLQKAFEKTYRELPRKFFIPKVKQKLEEAGIDPTPTRVERVIEAIFSRETSVDFGDDEIAAQNVSLNFNENDFTEILENVEKFINSGPDELIETVSNSLSSSKFKELKREWKQHKNWEESIRRDLAANLEMRWGAGLDFLGMILSVARDVGESFFERRRRSRSKKNHHKKEVLLLLHARSCVVCEEIIVLLRSGLASGAMARWRTLHELSIVMTLIAEHDDELAERYIAHDVVEAYKAAKLFETTHSDLGRAPFSKKAAQHLRRQYNHVIERFGEVFAGEYGWAANHLGLKNPRFRDLEVVAQQSQMRSHYKFASYHVHAGIKGIVNQLGNMPDSNLVLAGPSNAGLDEPGRNAAATLAICTVLLFGPNWKLDDIVIIKTIYKLWGAAATEFIKAGKQLEKDEKLAGEVRIKQMSG